MHLYSTSLVRGGACVGAIYGSFSGLPKAQEVVVNHGTWIELLQVAADGTLKSLGASEAFGIVRSLAALRTAGSQRDYVVVGSDSGCLAILSFDAEASRFVRARCETFGKSGVRRIVPGQYVAVDPMGRCVMTAAVEKQKLVFNVARDNADRLVVASPLEAHKQNALVLDVQALFVGLENPVFASLELDYSAPEAGRCVVLYEVEEGLNHVVRKSSQRTLESANKLIAVPGPSDGGPGGFLVCGEGWVEYQTAGQNPEKDVPLRARIPRRVDCPLGRPSLICCAAMNLRKAKGETSLFFLLQTELGDLFKLDLTPAREEPASLQDFSLQYFDTCPVGKALCITKRGFLFLGSEFGDHRLYRFHQLGGADDKTVVVRAKREGLDPAADQQAVTAHAKPFAPRRNRNLAVSFTRPSFAPAIDVRVAELFREDRNQILLACGRGARSSLRLLRHGLEVTEVAVTDLGGTPSAVWTIKKEGAPDTDQYIVVSFANVTMVLAVGENAVEQASDSGLKADVPTLAVCRLADGSIVQVHPQGYHRTGGKAGWTAPKKVDAAAINERQVVVALEGGEIDYFELDEAGELQQRRHDLGDDAKCLGLGAIPVGRRRAPFLLVGTFSKTLQVLSLDPAAAFRQLTVQALPDQPSSLALIEMRQEGKPVWTLCAGLGNGVLVRSRLDQDSGAITDTRSSFLGTRPVQCKQIQVPCDDELGKDDAGSAAKVQNALLALSSRPWLAYARQGASRLVPLSYQGLTGAASFSSDICNGVVSVAGSSLRIFELEDMEHAFNAKTFKLRYTPRRMLVHADKVVLIEGDHNVLTEAQQETSWRALKGLHDEQYPEDAAAGASESNGAGAGAGAGAAAAAEEDDEDEEEVRPPLSVEEVGLPLAGPGCSGRWASLVRVLDPQTGESTTLHLGDDQLAVSACFARLGSAKEDLLVVGVVQGLRLHPQEHKAASVHVYRVGQGSITLVTSATVAGGIPRAVCGISGMVAVGVGNSVRIFSLGQSKLLRKAMVASLPTSVCFLRAHGNRIFVGDAHDSVHLLKFDADDYTLTPFADDQVPRMCVAGEVLDYDTVAASDKFGSLFVLRLPSNVGDADASVDAANGDRMLWDQAKSAGAPNSLEQVVQYYMGETVTAMHKAALVPGKAEALVYCTVMGSVGALLPFASKKDLEFFSLLEMHLRSHKPELVGREHLPFRSYFSPVKGVVDGDLCREYDALPLDKREAIAAELSRPVAEISKKIQEMEAFLL